MNMYTEIEADLHRQRIKEEIDAIRLEEEATKGNTLLDKNLALLGNLMVSVGEKLRRRAHSSQEANSAKLINKAA
jgi:hypothetical protein